MLLKYEMLQTLTCCSRITSVLPVHLRHQRKALAQYGLTPAQRDELTRIFDRLIREARREADQLRRLRQEIVREGVHVH